MTKSEMNKQIINTVSEEIAKRKLTGKLEMYGCTNTFQVRPRYWTDGEVNYFKVFLWDLNSLCGDELITEINRRIDSAQNYFKL